MELIAMVHPSVTTTHASLTHASWKHLDRDVPLDVKKIKGTYMRKNIAKNGCCDALELVKLHAWLLDGYHLLSIWIWTLRFRNLWTHCSILRAHFRTTF
ncbi:hypothetical protein NSK_000156 [Nannochloropsis salina CCMP1776]|uniref:Uncharacterized protein n=1 Tax=Nannochloropsis salina CCMP1776 TaxID=1027361 RepID=A0A4D9DC24_9STRA|nr:hypothetical protein NSK_000156 [Nannochloropsis salina CCMP1776]|eukprot:TFJ88584.1 hypothetical protein NSK_000156 [Nannochloropsis salina CCMP1776]